MTTDIQKINDEVTRELANKETFNTLLAITFKGLEPENMKLAIVEGMIRGFTFQDFLEKNVYAIGFKNRTTGKQSYSLVVSIDKARKIGMKSNVIGKSVPVYEERDGAIISCSVTIKRKVGNDIGEFSSKVYFAEYTKGRDLWTEKPRTMIAKVAEMHALRMACPEEMSQVYVEEEVEKTIEATFTEKLDPIDVVEFENKLKAVKSLAELKTVWSAIPFEAKKKLESLKDELKKVLL
jgi:hypothetical protein